MQERPRWINPCGIRTDNGAVHDASTDIRQISDAELLTQIVDQAKIALSRAEQFKEDFVLQTFNTVFSKHHESWKGDHYEWLPSTEEVPKGLGQPVSSDHLEGLELDATLLDTYKYLQQIAVGLELVVLDQERQEAGFQSKFEDAEHLLRNLLCELQMTIYERNIKMRPDVTRSIITDEFRNNKDNTSINIRTWLIYRDYMNVLEYVIEVFNYLKAKL